jgi:hypothetical protein
MVERKQKQAYMPNLKKRYGGGKMKKLLYAQMNLRLWWR